MTNPLNEPEDSTDLELEYADIIVTLWSMDGSLQRMKETLDAITKELDTKDTDEQ